MNLKKYIAKHIKDLKIKRGDNVCVHANLSRFGISNNKLPLIIIKGILAKIGTQGTLCMPCYNFNLNNNKVYDPNKFYNKGNSLLYKTFFNKFKTFVSNKIIHRHACVGKKAYLLGGNKEISCFGKKSDFEFFFKNNFKILLLGCEPSEGLTYFHHLEKLVNVNYRKDIQLKILIKKNKSINITNLKYFALKNRSVKNNFNLFFNKLDIQYYKIPIKYGFSYCINLNLLHQASMLKLKKNLNSLIKNVH